MSNILSEKSAPVLPARWIAYVDCIIPRQYYCRLQIVSMCSVVQHTWTRMPNSVIFRCYDTLHNLARSELSVQYNAVLRISSTLRPRRIIVRAVAPLVIMLAEVAHFNLPGRLDGSGLLYYHAW